MTEEPVINIIHAAIEQLKDSNARPSWIAGPRSEMKGLIADLKNSSSVKRMKAINQ